MSDLNEIKLGKMFKILKSHKMKIIEKVPDDLKCKKCKNILNNSCLVSCGCNYCRSCIDNLLANGEEMCSNGGDDCMLGSLSNISIDYRANIKISKLIVKCTNKSCLHECRLIDMEEHLRLCKNKCIPCPLFELGCHSKDLPSDKLNEHFQLESYCHNKILIEMINNIKNDVTILKEKEKKNESEIEKLKQNLLLKDKKIESLNSKINQIKTEKSNLEQKFEIFNRNFQQKIDEIKTTKIDKKITDKIELINVNVKLIDKEKIELTKQMKLSNDKIDKTNANIDEQFRDLKQWRDALQQDVAICNDGTNMMTTRLQLVEKWIQNKTDGVFMWKIDDFVERRNNEEILTSEYFYARMEPYKMKLKLFTNGDDYFYGNGFTIYLNIYGDIENRDLNWPFTANVTIKIINKSNQNDSQIIKDYCIINKPYNNNYYGSQPFNFFYSDWINNTLLVDNSLNIECFIELLF